MSSTSAVHAPSPTVITGIGVSPGRVVAPAVLMPDPVAEPPSGRRLPPGTDYAAVSKRIGAASEVVRAALDAAADRAQGESADLLHATAAIAADPTLVADAEQRVVDDRLVPERAVWEAAEAVSAQFEELGGYFAERTRDIADVRDRLVAELTGRPAPGVPAHEAPFVLVAADLAPAIVATLDTERVLAIVTGTGGPTSHTAILARARGIPTVVAARGAEAAVLAEGLVLVDGSAGTVTVDPTEEQVLAALALAAQVRTFDGHGHTADGHHVELLANVGDPADAAPGRRRGRGGRRAVPDRVRVPRPRRGAEHRRAGHRLPPRAGRLPRSQGRGPHARRGRRQALAVPRRATRRSTPRSGSGACAPPRGTRRCSTDQLTAIARAAAAETADVWVMAPMVSTVDEAQQFVAACTAHGLPVAGVMIEVPSAALLSGPILAHAAFASIGTNDLTQYAMAADRLLGAVAELSDPWQPAVLHLVAAACAGGAQQGRPVGVCGEAAANPALAVVLVGLGVSSLSMTPRALPDVAALLAVTPLDECRRLAQLALAASSAADARAVVRAGLPVLEELGL